MAADPLWINANAGAPAYSAAELRQAMALPLMYGGRVSGARPGVRPGGTALTVSIAVSTISVERGVALVDPGLSTAQGPYWVGLPATETFTLSPADATNPRKDIVVLRVYDHDEDASGLRTARPEYLTGTPAPSPAEPAVPAGSFRLATIDVPASGGGSAAVTDRRPFTVAAGGILPLRNSTEQAAVSGYDGLPAYRMDDDTLRIHNGSAWRRMAIDRETYAPVQVEDTTDAGYSNTTYATGAPVVGAVFTAPPSGSVYITVSGTIASDVNANRALLGYEVRTGSTIGSGTVVLAADDDRALGSSKAVNTSASASISASRRYMLTGLTAGSPYNVRTMHRVDPAGGGSVSYRAVLVEPVP